MRAKLACALSVICMWFGLASTAHALTVDEAKTFADNLGHNALTILSNQSAPQEERRTQLEELFAKNVDIDWIGRFVLGRSWKTANDQQKSAYLEHYKAFILKHYTTNLAEFTEVSFNITKAVPEEHGGIIVTMHLKRPGKEDTVVDYNIREKEGGGPMVYDIIVEGVSMITTQRSEFGSVVSQHGLDYLIAQLDERSKKDAATANAMDNKPASK